MSRRLVYAHGKTQTNRKLKLFELEWQIQRDDWNPKYKNISSPETCKAFIVASIVVGVSFLMDSRVPLQNVGYIFMRIIIGALIFFQLFIFLM